MPVSTHDAAQQNSMAPDAAVHEAGLKNAEKRREEISEEKRLEGTDGMMEKAQEKHENVLLEQQGAVERDAHVHETGLKEAEERRNELSEEERRRIKNHNAIDERTDNVLDRHEKILADRQDAEERDLESHEHGLEEAERRRVENAQNELDRIKAHNAIEERTDQVLDRHEKILSDRQAAEERDLKSHEHGLEEAERRRDKIAQNELDRIKAHNAIDERTDQVLDRHEKILSDRQHAEERDLKSHEHGLEEAERRRDENAQNELDRIKAHNAIEERTDQVLDRHDKILSDRQAAEERDLKSHEHGLEEAERRRDEIAQNELDRIKAHNAIDERTDQVLDRHEKILSDRQAAEERDLESHEHGLEEAERRRDENAQKELDRVKAHNAIEERTDQVLDRHEKILSDRQDAEERDLKSHEHGLEEAERRRDEIAQKELDRIKAHNAIDERTDQVLDRHENVLSDRQAAEERDLESHEHGMVEAERRRDEHAQNELDRIKAHNAIDERTDNVLDRHKKILSDRQAAEERDLESHEHGLEEAERRRDENAQNELDRIKAHNALEEKSKQALEKKSRVLTEHEKSAERDLHMHEEALDKAEHRRASIHDDEMDRIKANNALEEKSKQALEKKSRVLTEQEKSAERDIHDHDKALDRAEQRRASIREDQIRSIKAYNNLDELEQRAAEKREELAAANSQSLEEDIARTEARMERAEKVKSETVKDRVRAAKETLMNLNDVRKRHEEIERERERNAILHFERVDDGVNRAIARRDSAVGDSMDVSKTRAYPSQAAHTDSSEIVE